MGYAIHDKDLRLTRAWNAQHGETPWERWRSGSQCISKGLLASPTVETIAKWFDLPPQFIEIKRSEHVFRLCSHLTHETERLLGKHHYDDSEITLLTFVRNTKGKKCACATGKSFLNETDSATKS